MVIIYLIAGYLLSILISYYIFMKIKYLEKDFIKNWGKNLSTIIVVICFMPILNILVSFGVAITQWTIDVICE